MRKPQARNAFDEELVSVEVPGRPPHTVERDEHPRGETTMEALAKLKPAFIPNGTVTAGNSSGINDGAAALLLCDAETGERLGVEPLARVMACASAGVATRRHGAGSRFQQRNARCNVPG